MVIFWILRRQRCGSLARVSEVVCRFFGVYEDLLLCIFMLWRERGRQYCYVQFMLFLSSE